MNEAEYRRWWDLHLRVAREETLNEQEQADYESGRKILDAEESARLRQTDAVAAAALMRKEIDALEEEERLLIEQRERLTKRAAYLEQQLRALERPQTAVEAASAVR